MTRLPSSIVILVAVEKMPIAPAGVFTVPRFFPTMNDAPGEAVNPKLDTCINKVVNQ